MQPSFLDPDAHAYLATLVPARSRVHARIEELARAERQPAVSPQTGAVLRVLAAASGGRRILEVGCNLGYSALWLLAGMRADGVLDTIEIDPELAERARRHFEEAEAAARVHVHEGAALDVLPGFEGGSYDLVFLDAVKAEYPAYLEHARRLLRPGGIVAGDNAFWAGQVWDAEAEDADTQGLRAFTRALATDAAWAAFVLPVGDGLAVGTRVGGA